MIRSLLGRTRGLVDRASIVEIIPLFDGKATKQLAEVFDAINLLGDGLSHQSLLIDEERELNHLNMY